MFLCLSRLRLYRQPYSFIIALALAIVDIIPLLGTIAILVPWGANELIGGDSTTGIFLILLGFPSLCLED